MLICLIWFLIYFPAGVDFRNFSVNLTIPGGSSAGSLHCIQVHNVTIDDFLLEEAEFFIVKAVGFSHSVMVATERRTAFVYIVDNESMLLALYS